LPTLVIVTLIVKDLARENPTQARKAFPQPLTRVTIVI